jgi:leucyl aminopeptidase
MEIKIQSKLSMRSGVAVIPFFRNKTPKFSHDYPEELKRFIIKRFKDKEFQGEFGETIFSYIDSKSFASKILIVGLGEKEKFDQEVAREWGAKTSKKLKRIKATKVTLFFGEEIVFLQEILEGLLMAEYDIGKLKTHKEKKESQKLEQIDIIIPKNNSKQKAEETTKKTQLIVKAVDYIKDLVNSPANIVDAEYLASSAKEIAKTNRYKLTIFGNKELKKMRAGGILAVNQGSKNDAKLIVLEYNGGKKGEAPIILAGKGVVFDTGGYNLKPVGNIETMQQDMSGAGTILGIFKILKELKISKNIIGVAGVVSNMISDTAYRPSDIITMMNGKTVEVTNTDAEGRIVLADVLTYSLKFNPEMMISVATLTGAVGVALGNRYAGLFGNDEKIKNALKKAGEETDDLLWELPIHKDFRKRIKSDFADYQNLDHNSKSGGGASKAGAFLEKFIDNKKWAHIDTGGTAFTSEPKEYQQKGATGHGLRALLKFLESK